MRDLLASLVVTVLAVGLIFGSIIGFIASVDYLDCRGFREATGYETRWHWGCYAKHEGRWVPKAYVFGDANELRVKQERERG